MQILHKPGQVQVVADSFGDFLKWIDENKSIWGPIHQKQSGAMNFQFTGTRSFEEAEELCRKGWPEGLRKAQALIAEIEPKLFSFIKVRQTEYTFAGGNPDVGVFLANQPEYFLSHQEVQVHRDGKLARVVVNITASSAYTKDQLIMRGVAVLAVVDAMEKQGRSCELVVACTARHGKIYEIEIPLKKQGEAADLDRIAFALAHPSFFRRYCLAAFDVAGNHIEYGCPAETLCDRGDLYFKAISSDQCPTDNEKLIQWILTMPKSQGIELEDS